MVISSISVQSSGTGAIKHVFLMWGGLGAGYFLCAVHLDGAAEADPVD